LQRHFIFKIEIYFFSLFTQNKTKQIKNMLSDDDELVKRRIEYSQKLNNEIPPVSLWETYFIDKFDLICCRAIELAFQKEETYYNPLNVYSPLFTTPYYIRRDLINAAEVAETENEINIYVVLYLRLKFNHPEIIDQQIAIGYPVAQVIWTETWQRSAASFNHPSTQNIINHLAEITFQNDTLNRQMNNSYFTQIAPVIGISVID